ncbi:MAG: diguanylate cyclase, partial [Acidobacteriota bacterium]|nr:diguanylate cyclase [Acidobacteriota bacterium]
MQTEQILVVAVVFFIGLALVSFGLLLREKHRNARLNTEGETLKDKSKQHHQMMQERDSMQQFLAEFSRLSTALHEAEEIRRVPESLHRMMLRTLDPREALVLVRRRSTGTNPQRAHQLVVAAAGPLSSGRVGQVLSLDEGELGLVARSGVVMDRKDLDQSRAQNAGSGISGFKTDLAAPMMIAGSTFGLLAVSEPLRLRSYAKHVLQLTALAGASKFKSTRTLSKVQTAADTDALTGIHNKRVLTRRLGELVYDAGRKEGQVSVFIFDIDNFKNYNDLHGHVAGDKLLQTLARLVQSHVREEDTFGRFGGEEFLLILKDQSAEQARHAGDNIRKVIEEYDFAHREQQPLGALTISGGVATFPADADTSVRLLQAADGALYAAKKAGRNRVRVAGDLQPAAQGTHPGPRNKASVVNGDDLRAIRGIGVRFESKLRKAGIGSYRQIARFPRYGLSNVAALLGIEVARVERDGWIEQAKQ